MLAVAPQRPSRTLETLKGQMFLHDNKMSQVTCMIYQNKASGQRVLFLSLKHVSILVHGHPQASSSLIGVVA